MDAWLDPRGQRREAMGTGEASMRPAVAATAFRYRTAEEASVVLPVPPLTKQNPILIIFLMESAPPQGAALHSAGAPPATPGLCRRPASAPRRRTSPRAA